MSKHTTIVIKDEVNCAFLGLDATTRRKLVTEVEYFLPYAKHTPAFKLGRWNGKVSFCDISGRTYINLLDRLLPIVVDSGYAIEIDDRREQHSFTFDEIDTDSYSHIKWPEGHPMAGEPILLREHQVEVLNGYFANPQCLHIAPTGAGKTIICAVMSHNVEKYGKSVVIVPSKDLVTQTEEDYINMGLSVGVFFGDRKDFTKTHTICTWQSLEALYKKDKEVLSSLLEECICVIVDECFSGGTRVLTPAGYKAIELLSAGDTVINFSEKDGIFKEDVVIKLHENLITSTTEKMYELLFDNGSVINVTGNHKFLTFNRGWVRADEIELDDDIVNFDK